MFRLLLVALALGGSVASAQEEWKLHPDAAEQPDVPKGTVTQMPAWLSEVFPGTTRDWSVFVPAQYRPDGSAALMVFQDGRTYASLKGVFRTPTVLDNLIAAGALPPTVAVFVEPGNDVAHPAPPTEHPTNRPLEYDSLGDRYARFLIEEILPAVEKKWPVSHDPALHAIGGSSSGAICAFTVAWERPDAFRRVYSSVGTFVNRGASYPPTIRQTDMKPLRVYLEDVSGDKDTKSGNWPIANRQMNAALLFRRYDVRFDFAEGYGHNGKHAGSIFPDALRWLWRQP